MATTSLTGNPFTIAGASFGNLLSASAFAGAPNSASRTTAYSSKSSSTSACPRESPKTRRCSPSALSPLMTQESCEGEVVGNLRCVRHIAFFLVLGMSATLVYHFLLGGLPRQRRGGFSPALRPAGVGYQTCLICPICYTKAMTTNRKNKGIQSILDLFTS